MELPPCPDGVVEQLNEQVSYLTAGARASQDPFGPAIDAVRIRRLFWNEILPTYPLCTEVVVAAIVNGRLLDEWATRLLADAAGRDDLLEEAEAELDRIDLLIENLSTTSLKEFIGANETSIEDRPFMTPGEVHDAIGPAVSEAASIVTLPESEQFSVIVNGNVNLRECAGTHCAVVGTATNGSVLTVLAAEQGTDGEWYLVRRNDGSTAYIASWLTTRGPDAMISTDEAYTDLATMCIVAFDIKRGNTDINVILAGDGRNQVIVDLFKPNQTTAVRVNAQYDKTFIDTGDPYIHQTYRWSEYWPTGVYQLEISRGGETTRLAWELERQGEYNIFVYCQ